MQYKCDKGYVCGNENKRSSCLKKNKKKPSVCLQFVNPGHHVLFILLIQYIRENVMVHILSKFLMFLWHVLFWVPATEFDQISVIAMFCCPFMPHLAVLWKTACCYIRFNSGLGANLPSMYCIWTALLIQLALIWTEYILA